MATKSSQDIQNNIKRLRVILDKQRESLKSLDINDPEFNQLKGAIAKTQSEISKNDVEYNKILKVENATKAREDLRQAQTDLQYAEATGDSQEITKAKEAISKAKTSTEAATIVASEKQTPAASAAALGLSSTQMAPATPAVKKPTAGAGGASGAGSTGGGTKAPVVPAKTKTELESDALAAAADLTLPETLFRNVPSLAALLKKYTDPKLGMTKNEFLKELRDDVWYKQNSAEIKARYIQKFNYDDLVKTGQATGSSDYEKQIATLEANLKKRADVMGSAAASDPAALRRVAENMYITNQGIDDAMTTDFLAAAIKPIGGMIGGKGTLGYSGQALQNYQTLQAAAKANGFQVSDIIPGGQNEQQILAGIATGAIDVNRIAQDARKLAAQGQPQYVRDLLGQGYNLDQVYAPYRQTMANILEIGDPKQIDLNDPTLRTAITDKGDMNLFDFKKALRQDQRWQYTDQARQEVSGTALNVLRDFGFQG